jgi:hypothetical protein
MTNEYLRAFVIGSSFLVFFPYFFIVSQINPKDKNYSYLSYSFIAPLFLGGINMFSLYIQKIYRLSREERFFFISMFAPTFVFCVSLITKVYHFSLFSKWIVYLLCIYLLYFIVWNIIVYYLDKYL